MSEARSIAALRAVPWRNGGGLTRELLRGSTDYRGEPSWRISVATVTDGAEFSVFTSYDRLFVPLERDRIVLLGANGVLAADPSGAVAFDGGNAVRARVQGSPVEALNVMSRRGHRAWTQLRSLTGELCSSSPSRKALVVLSGVVTEPGHDDILAPAVIVTATRAAVVDAQVLEIFIELSPRPDQEPS